jgi:cytidine deaminase
MANYMKIKITPCSYCSKCLRDFEHEEFVHYVVNDNDCVCAKCSNTFSAQKEPRAYIKN